MPGSKKSNFRREWFWVLVIGFCIIEFKNYFIGVNQDKNVTGVGSKGGEELEAPSLEMYWKRVAVKRGRGRKKKGGRVADILNCEIWQGAKGRD